MKDLLINCWLVVRETFGGILCVAVFITLAVLLPAMVLK